MMYGGRQSETRWPLILMSRRVNIHLRVKSYNIDGIKSEKALRIIIDPPWWKTKGAYAVYGYCSSSHLGCYAYPEATDHKNGAHSQAKELEQAKEIEIAYTELKATQTQLIQSEKMASLGELTAGIAHEIQNPLNFVNNFSEVNKELARAERGTMKMESTYKNQLEEIAGSINNNQEKILHHGKRADAIVKGMLQHSRSSTGIKEPTDINQLADEYLRLAYHGLRAKDKSFNTAMKTELDPQIGKVNLVAQDIGRVLLNLFNNAFYAVNERKQQADAHYQPLIELSTKKTGGKIYISIRDNGNGIPKKVMDKIFQPFFTTKPTGQGTGLGLSLSFDIIKAHGGEWQVQGHEGEGAEFRILIPVA